jgi:hypothetical protein
MVLYISFTGLIFFQILAKNPKGLAFGFPEKFQFAAKTDLNSVFLGHKTHILDRLHIMVPYISFHKFFKIHISAENRKGLAFGFTEKHYFAEKLTKTPYFLVINHIFLIGYTQWSRIYVFMSFLKKSNFGSKSKMVSLQFYRKMPHCAENWPKLSISSS